MSAFTPPSWIEECSVEGLLAFFSAKAASGSVTAGDHLILAIFHVHRRNDQEALAGYESVLQLDPANAGAWFARGCD